MEFLRRPRQTSQSLALFAGAFHPPTNAHVALAKAARLHTDETLWVLPRNFPHKTYAGIGLEERAHLLLEATSDAIAIAEENYFFAMAKELQRVLPDRSVKLLIGEDGAERLFTWDYGLDEASTQAMLHAGLQEFPLLTARRESQWTPPPEFAASIHWLDLPPEASTLSSTLVRDLISTGSNWRAHVPGPIAHRIAELYGSASH